MNERREKWLIDVLWRTASESTCPRTHVAAILHRDGRIISTGYNGSAPGKPHCIDVGCLVEWTTNPVNGKSEEHCRRANHAEANAVAHAARFGISVEGASLLTTHQPCRICQGILAVAGVENIVSLSPYLSDTGE